MIKSGKLGFIVLTLFSCIFTNHTQGEEGSIANLDEQELSKFNRIRFGEELHRMLLETGFSEKNIYELTIREIKEYIRALFFFLDEEHESCLSGPMQPEEKEKLRKMIALLQKYCKSVGDQTKNTEKTGVTEAATVNK